MDKPVTSNPWSALQQFTAARIALGRSGVSQPTAPQLAFQQAHARARDAVHLALDPVALGEALHDASGLPWISLHSAAPDRNTYLQRPDLGRRLDDASRAKLAATTTPAAAATTTAPADADPSTADAVTAAMPAAAIAPATPSAAGACYDLALVVADGLSALAIEQNAAPLIRALMARLSAEQWRLAPITIVQQGRVAIGDEVAHLLDAQAVVVLIGERPGLSSPDSMGLYLTWAPRPGLTDASRNCISNVRPAGLTCDAAAFKLHYLLSEARRRQLSGVALKDETASDSADLEAPRRNFLLE
ncbi:ethanolamine ammonia-lyase subunit EutC [Duganella dendranthematis]|uniref:Ethanolamine ammonia-lyase small subunit n=1 Tax=Duganella dendranthematis TaxID=2728021 RepID=A0ABX6M7E5_9BURK|nr:ethanolamine ammonia-lyase subunit EutC [Duganella dendranthematis]QJD90233.1 ethanolamine ammonia-lyase subunit EutC [Duganella dendranthematis]